MGELVCPGNIFEDACRRSLQLATAIKITEFKRGLSGLATIGSTAPLPVGVVAVWLSKYFINKIDNFVVELETTSAELINFFLKQQLKSKN
jgi:biopolymer transport protein ExbB/TolQ